MIVKTFFEQLALQLGIGQIHINKKRRRRRRTTRSIRPRSNLDETGKALWFIFSEVRTQTWEKFQPTGLDQISMNHIGFIREVAATENFANQREELDLGRRPKFYAAEDAWDLWQEIFEEMVKESHLGSSSTSKH